jgi:hypothetical protein
MGNRIHRPSGGTIEESFSKLKTRYQGPENPLPRIEVPIPGFNPHSALPPAIVLNPNAGANHSVIPSVSVQFL